MSSSVKSDSPNVLLVNPWIHDFAAYDFWAKPMGLLMLAAILRKHDIHVHYVDCLDRFHPKAPKTDISARNGRGPYLKTPIPKPKGLEYIPRHYSRYGIKQQWLISDLESIPQPDLIFVTSLMTYWYPGVKETIRIIRNIFPHSPVVLGGIYATLYAEHAKINCGADHVFEGPGAEQVLKIVKDHTGYNVKPKFDANDLNSYPYPAFDMQYKIPYVPLLTSMGCPFSCAYCASRVLNPTYIRRNPQLVVEEIKYWHDYYGVKNFAFYDDALLVNAQNHIIPLLEGVMKAGIDVKFHTPNAVHIREITKEVADLMKKTGFKTIRLGLETGSFSHRISEMDEKVNEEEFKLSVMNLKNAGFESDQIGAYLLCGLPGESLNGIIASIKMVKDNGILPVLAHYTPIPHTKLWPKAVAASRYDLESDPIFANNAISPCQKESFSWERLSDLKKMTSD